MLPSRPEKVLPMLVQGAWTQESPPKLFLAAQAFTNV
jgi:hypothetical protein